MPNSQANERMYDTYRRMEASRDPYGYAPQRTVYNENYGAMAGQGLSNPEVFNRMRSRGPISLLTDREKEFAKEWIMPTVLTGGLTGSLGLLAQAQKIKALKKLYPLMGEAYKSKFAPVFESGLNEARRELAEGLGQTALKSRSGLSSRNISKAAQRVDENIKNFMDAGRGNMGQAIDHAEQNFKTMVEFADKLSPRQAKNAKDMLKYTEELKSKLPKKIDLDGL